MKDNKDEFETKFQSEESSKKETKAPEEASLLSAADLGGKIKNVQVRSQTHQPLLVQCTCDKEGTLKVDIMDTALPDKNASVVALSKGFTGIPVKQID